MTATTMTETTVAELLAELAALEDPKARAVNERHGDDHGVNLGKLRAVAKRLKTQQELARRLWETERHRGATAGAADLPPEGVRARRARRDAAQGARAPRCTTGW